MPIIVANKAGFCSGVRRAVDALLEQSALHGCGSTLGPLVHNEEVVAFLRQHQINAVEETSEASGAFLAVRTHGVSPAVFDQMAQLKNIKIIDLTCPRVRRVQKIAAALKEKEIRRVIFGDNNHPEVEGLIGWAGGKTEVVSSLTELEQLKIDAPVALIAQTTSNPELYAKAKELLLKKVPGGLIYDTLCPETKFRQEEAVDLSQRVDALIVVGSQSSANTRALFDSCRQLKPSCRVANVRELDRSFLRKYRVFGVTAGTSTPPWTIKEVVERMEKENMEVKEEENEEVFEYAGEVKVAQIGEQVTGKVARVTAEEVYVDIGAKAEAILPASEVHLDEGKILADYFTPEDDVEVTVLDIDEQEGKVVVSHKRLAREKRLQELEQDLENGVILEGRVKQVVPAGIVIDMGSG
ncbi:MAG: 4-hydroxy-3-methylbut-2-enyl diphosphate reductase, partial [Clostridia bacterium]|nr:4-hydroxy-3-methylbut-2-enyl diphosphate reductase [Clostridia bacterium]